MGADGGKTKLEIFEKSYAEVLALIKHQDDKLNRILTALAFLTAAGIALYTQFGAKVVTRLDGSDAPLTTILFIVFISSVVLALASCLAAIGPNNFFNREREHKGAPGPLPAGSLIYFGHILRLNDEEWDRFLAADEALLNQRLMENLHSEARGLSKRVAYKMTRSREASALAHVAILALALQGIFAVGGATPETQETLSFTTQWSLAGGLLVIAGGFPLIDLGVSYLVGLNEKSQMSSKEYGRIRVGLLALAAFFVFAPARDAHWPALGYALGFILVSRLALALVDQRQRTRLLDLCMVGILVTALLFVLT